MYPFATLASDVEQLLADLVSDEKRRGYLKTLAAQLKALGISVFDCASVDGQRVTWEQAKQRWESDLEEARVRRARDAARMIDEETRTDAVLPPVARKAVARRRRRQQRKARR